MYNKSREYKSYWFGQQCKQRKSSYEKISTTQFIVILFDGTDRLIRMMEEVVLVQTIVKGHHSVTKSDIEYDMLTTVC